MSLPRVVAVIPGSPAARAGLLPGDEIVTMAGQVPRDIIQYQLLADEPEVEFELRRGGLEHDVTVVRDGNEPLGIEVHSALFDQVRTCDNHCEFCFIYQLPKGLRPSLYVKDDDYRLSFLYGNFTTLTRFTEADLERVVTEGLSPLWVSIHATDPRVRARMLRNQRGATSLRWLRALLDHGIEIHGQVVVCPGINDGAVLDDTLAGVLDEYPELKTVAVVPLGVSRYTTEPAMRAHTRAEAAAAVDLVEGWQQTFLECLGRRVVFGADEYYLLAGRPFPLLETYEDLLQHENGIGMAAAFEVGLLRSDGAAPRRAKRVLPGRRRRPRPRLPGAPEGGRRDPAASPPRPGGGGLRRIRRPHPRPAGGALRRPGGHRPQRVLRGQHRRGRPAGRRRPGPGPGATSLRGTATCCPTPASPAACSSTACRRTTFPGRGGHRHRRPEPARGARAVSTPVVAVVGRPNVGKSTLVNRLVGGREAIVEEQPGVTRDRKLMTAEWRGRHFTVIDTGGWLAGGTTLDRQVSAQAERAIAQADVILLVVDTTVGVADEDARVARLLRRSTKPTVVVANKVDANSRESDAWTFERLGLGDPSMVSALHGRGTGDLLDLIVDRLPPESEEPGSPEVAAQADGEPSAPSVAIVGRPNVGKSTLFNRLIGDERSIVHDLPGTTRDTIDTVVETSEGPIRFVDTAGLRRRGKEAEGTEYYSLVRALQAIDSADAALFVIDATEGVTHQDQRLAERVDGAGNPIVLHPQQMGTARRRGPGQRARPGRGPVVLFVLLAAAQDQRPDRPRRPQAAARPSAAPSRPTTGAYRPGSSTS